MMAKSIYMFLAMTMLSFQCASTPLIIASDSDNGKSLKIKKGELLEIRLESQMSTGFGWKIRTILGLVQKGSTEVITEMSGKTGGKDIQKMIFLANQTGNGSIELVYVQTWDEKSHPEKLYRLNFVIE
jgi:inhibitor of cysteine peptidase